MANVSTYLWTPTSGTLSNSALLGSAQRLSRPGPDCPLSELVVGFFSIWEVLACPAGLPAPAPRAGRVTEECHVRRRRLFWCRDSTGLVGGGDTGTGACSGYDAQRLRWHALLQVLKHRIMLHRIICKFLVAKPGNFQIVSVLHVLQHYVR